VCQHCWGHARRTKPDPTFLFSVCRAFVQAIQSHVYVFFVYTSSHNTDDRPQNSLASTLDHNAESPNFRPQKNREIFLQPPSIISTIDSASASHCSQHQVNNTVEESPRRQSAHIVIASNSCSTYQVIKPMSIRRKIGKR